MDGGCGVKIGMCLNILEGMCAGRQTCGEQAVTIQTYYNPVKQVSP